MQKLTMLGKAYGISKQLLKQRSMVKLRRQSLAMQLQMGNTHLWNSGEA